MGTVAPQKSKITKQYAATDSTVMTYEYHDSNSAAEEMHSTVLNDWTGQFNPREVTISVAVHKCVCRYINITGIITIIEICYYTYLKNLLRKCLG